MSVILFWLLLLFALLWFMTGRARSAVFLVFCFMIIVWLVIGLPGFLEARIRSAVMDSRRRQRILVGIIKDRAIDLEEGEVAGADHLMRGISYSDVRKELLVRKRGYRIQPYQVTEYALEPLNSEEFKTIWKDRLAKDSRAAFVVFIDEATIHVIGRGPDKVFNSDYPTDSFIHYDPTNGSKSAGDLVVTASR